MAINNLTSDSVFEKTTNIFPSKNIKFDQKNTIQTKYDSQKTKQKLFLKNVTNTY